MDVTLTFRKSELGVVNLSRNLSPNFHPVSFGSEKLQNTRPQMTKRGTEYENRNVTWPQIL